jgi:Tfp pilus assembly protein PilV
MGAKANRHGEAGFTLIEATIAMVILVTGLVAIANLNLVAIGSNSLANQMTAAANVAADRMEILKDTRYTDPALDEGGDPDYDTADPAYRREVTVPGVGLVRVAWQITQVDDRTKFITVRADIRGLGRVRGRSEFTTFRTCTTPVFGCPTT